VTKRTNERVVPVRGTTERQLHAMAEALTICKLDELPEGEFDAAACTVECPRHGSLFDLRTGRPKTLPAFLPVETFEARIRDGEITLEH